MNRPDPMIPSKPGAEDIEVQANKQAWIEALYKYEGRDDKDHPMHGLYTGLMKKHYNTMSTDG
jgi:hypothetical protein